MHQRNSKKPLGKNDMHDGLGGDDRGVELATCTVVPECLHAFGANDMDTCKPKDV